MLWFWVVVQFGEDAHFVRDDKFSGWHFERQREIFLRPKADYDPD
jgi:hypothetical protein